MFDLSACNLKGCDVLSILFGQLLTMERARSEPGRGMCVIIGVDMFEIWLLSVFILFLLAMWSPLPSCDGHK